jgi:hypothetical protein
MIRATNQAKRQQWADRLERFQGSGQTVAEFCRAECVSPPSFYHWRRKLGHAVRRRRRAKPAGGSAVSTAFKAVHVVPTERARGVTVQLGDRIMLDLGHDAELIEKVVGQLLRHHASGERRPC